MNDPIYIARTFFQRKDSTEGFKGYEVVQGRTVNVKIYNTARDVWVDAGEFFMPEMPFSEWMWLALSPTSASNPVLPRVELFSFIDDGEPLFFDDTCGFVDSDVNGLQSESSGL